MREMLSINPLLVVTQKTDLLSLICFTSILGHAVSRIDYYVNAFIEREPRTFIHVKRAKRFDPVG